MKARNPQATRNSIPSLAAFMKQGYNDKAPYPKTVPSVLPRKNLTLNAKEKIECGNEPETFEWSFKLRRQNANRVNMQYRGSDCASPFSADTEFETFAKSPQNTLNSHQDI